MKIFTLSFFMSLIVLLLTKSVGLFNHMQLNIHHQMRDFETKTLKYHLNNKKGSITLFGIVLLTIFSGFLLVTLKIMQKEFMEAKYRKEAYLCFIYQDQTYRKYFKEMIRFNQVIATTYAAQFIPLAGKAAKIAYEAEILARNLRHFYYLKKFLVNDYCKVIEHTNPFLRNLPFETNANIMLRTDLFGLADIKEKPIEINFHYFGKEFRKLPQFKLRANYTFDHRLSTYMKVSTEEL